MADGQLYSSLRLFRFLIVAFRFSTGIFGESHRVSHLRRKVSSQVVQCLAAARYGRTPKRLNKSQIFALGRLPDAGGKVVENQKKITKLPENRTRNGKIVKIVHFNRTPEEVPDTLSQ
jgi:hypothetical protein